MKILLLALLLITQTHALTTPFYEAVCITDNPAVAEEGQIINLSLDGNELTIEVNQRWRMCGFLGSYKDEIFFYQCDEFKVTFRNHMTEMMFSGYDYTCVFTRGRRP